MTSISSMLTNLAPHQKRRLLAELLHPECGGNLDSARSIEEASIYAHRSLFSALADKSYFNYGARGPISRPALDAIREALEEYEIIGPFSHDAVLLYERWGESLRETLAGIFSVRADSVALTENTTGACNIALWGIDWKPGDHLLLSDCEHLSAIAVAQEIRDRFSVRLTFFGAAQAANSAELVEAFERELHSRTRLIVVSHVLWNTGVVMPVALLRQIAQQRTGGRCQVLVDGAQAAGLLNTGLEGDFYAFPACKWFCGPPGMGALIVSAETRERLRPVFGGWRGAVVSEPDGMVRWHDDARRYETGMCCHALYRGWEAAIRVQGQWGDSSARAARALDMARAAWNRLVSLRHQQELPEQCVLSAEPPDAGIVSLRLPDAEGVARRLEAEGVYARSIPHFSRLRICTHYLTTHLDVQRLTEVLTRSVNRGARPQ